MGTKEYCPECGTKGEVYRTATGGILRCVFRECPDCDEAWGYHEVPVQ